MLIEAHQTGFALDGLHEVEERGPHWRRRRRKGCILRCIFGHALQADPRQHFFPCCREFQPVHPVQLALKTRKLGVIADPRCSLAQHPLILAQTTARRSQLFQEIAPIPLKGIKRRHPNRIQRRAIGGVQNLLHISLQALHQVKFGNTGGRHAFLDRGISLIGKRQIHDRFSGFTQNFRINPDFRPAIPIQRQHSGKVRLQLLALIILPGGIELRAPKRLKVVHHSRIIGFCVALPFTAKQQINLERTVDFRRFLIRDELRNSVFHVQDQARAQHTLQPVRVCPLCRTRQFLIPRKPHTFPETGLARVSVTGCHISQILQIWHHHRGITVIDH